MKVVGPTTVGKANPEEENEQEQNRRGKKLNVIKYLFHCDIFEFSVRFSVHFFIQV